MQNGAVLRDVDLVASEHGFEPFTQAGLLRKIEEKLQGLAGDAVLGIVKVESNALDGQMLAAGRVLCKQFSQVQIANLLVMSCEGFPGWTLGDLGMIGRFDASCHAFSFTV
jgi:hypothetical protein